MTFIQEIATQQLARVASPTQLDQEYIFESLRQASPMLKNVAMTYNLEFDDLYQEAYLVCHKIMSDPTKPHVRSYLHAAIRIEMFRSLGDRTHAVSLDAPLSDESDLALIDLLVAPEKPQQTRRDYYRKRALLKALRRLPAAQQRAIQLLYQLDHMSVASHFSNKKTALIMNRSNAYEKLRSDKYLNTAIMGKWR